jgi:hypothetical protein
LRTAICSQERSGETPGIRIPQTVFFKKDPSLDGDGGEVRQQKLALSEVLVILGGSSTNIGVTSNKRTRLRDQILITMD